MGMQELEECLGLLVGDTNTKTALPTEILADGFAEDILGFEEVEEIEGGEDGQDAGGAAGAGMSMGGAGAFSAGMGVIPEEN